MIYRGVEDTVNPRAIPPVVFRVSFHIVTPGKFLVAIA